MAWLETHQSLIHHPKTHKAMALMGIPKVQVLGHLFCLWCWAMDYAANGDLTRFDAGDIARAAEWDGDANAFLAALIDCRFGDGAGFLERTEDGRLVIHDWGDYAGKLIARRQVDTARKRGERLVPPANGNVQQAEVLAHPPDDRHAVETLSSMNNADIQRTSSGHPADIQRTSSGHPAVVMNSTADIQRTAHVEDQPNRTNLTGPTNRTNQQDRTVAPDADAPDAPLPAGAATPVLLQPVPKRARSPDPIWESLSALFGEPLLDGERSLRNGVTKAFRDGAAKKGITPTQMAALITAAQSHWANVMGNATCTPTAILKHFTLLLAGPQKDGRSDGVVRAHTQKVTEYASVARPVSTADVRRQGRVPRAN